MATQLEATETRDLFVGASRDYKEAELSGMVQMLQLVAHAPRRDWPSIVGMMRRVIESKREDVAVAH